MKKICEYIGGSKSYGLETPESDVDIRGIYLSNTIEEILGLRKNEQITKQNDKEDSSFWELKHFLRLLKSGNTSALEMIHNQVWVEKSYEMDIIQELRKHLLDSNVIYKTLKGYSYGERKLIFGTAHTGQIGEKRKKAVEKYGYSYRNASHAMRLIRAGILFFKTDIYPVNIVEVDKEYGQLIYSIKTNPSVHRPEDIESKLIKLEEQLNDAFNNRLTNYTFNDKVANELCYQLYMPLLKNF